jgi:hypothetical protein
MMQRETGVLTLALTAACTLALAQRQITTTGLASGGQMLTGSPPEP